MHIAECSAAGFSIGTPLANLNSRSTFVTLNEVGRPPQPAEAWLRVAEVSNELLRGGGATAAPDGPLQSATSIHSSQTTKSLKSELEDALGSGGVAAPPPQFATSVRSPQRTKALKRELEDAQPMWMSKMSKRFFTAPMVGGAHVQYTLLGMPDSLPLCD
jgi:hypothetical protein